MSHKTYETCHIIFMDLFQRIGYIADLIISYAVLREVGFNVLQVRINVLESRFYGELNLSDVVMIHCDRVKWKLEQFTFH